MTSDAHIHRSRPSRGGSLSFRCHAHCSGCGCHFTGVSAFDAHRQGEGKARHCVDPMDDPRFLLKTEDGVCDLRGERTGVRVWRLARDAERAVSREGFRSNGLGGADAPQGREAA